MANFVFASISHNVSSPVFSRFLGGSALDKTGAEQVTVYSSGRHDFQKNSLLEEETGVVELFVLVVDVVRNNAI